MSFGNVIGIVGTGAAEHDTWFQRVLYLSNLADVVFNRLIRFRRALFAASYLSAKVQSFQAMPDELECGSCD
jgi:hypothetical protein